MKTISVIIPHYNSPALLKRLLGSIPRDPEIQIIVVDDNSTKDLELLDLVRKDAVKQGVEFYRNETNVQSAGAARNVGLKHAEGLWLLFADADDYFLPEAFDCFKKEIGNSADIVFFNLSSIYSDSGMPANRHTDFDARVNAYRSSPGEKEALALRFHFGVPYAKMIRHSLILDHNIRFDEIPVANDEMFSAKAGAYASSISVGEGTVYCITTSPGTLTAVVNDERSLIRADVWIRKNRLMRSVLSPETYKMARLPVKDTMEWFAQLLVGGCSSSTVIRIYRLFRKERLLPPGALFRVLPGNFRRLLRFVGKKTQTQVINHC